MAIRGPAARSLTVVTPTIVTVDRGISVRSPLIVRTESGWLSGSVERALCRIRLEHGPRADARALSALPRGRDRLAARLAAHLRRRGPRLGRRAADGRTGPGEPGLRRPVRRVAAGHAHP